MLLVALVACRGICLALDPGTGAGALGRDISALIAELREREATLPESARLGPGPLAEVKLAIRKIEKMQARPLWPEDIERIRGLLCDARLALLRLGTADISPAGRVGFQERAYISEIDGSAEPFLLYVPTRYDPAQMWPLLVFLHGYHHALDVANWRDLMYSVTLQEVCEREGVILLMPYGRGNTEFMGIGERDVLDTIACVEREYRVDPDRIILSGASMGGSGALSIACHWPDRFAALVLITARVDFYQWMRRPREAMPRFKQVQADTDYAGALMPNLAHVPVLEFHGELDTEFAAQAARLEALCEIHGVRCQIVEFPGQDHYIWSSSFTHPAFLEVLRSARRVSHPEQVVYRTYTVKYPGPYGLRIGGLCEWGRPAQVRIERGPDGCMTLRAENCASVTLFPPLASMAPPERWNALLDGEELIGELGGDGKIVFSKHSTERVASGLRKTPALCGPIREAYAGPFLIVFPAGKAPGSDTDRGLALRLAEEWRDYAQAEPQLVPDSAVTGAMISRYNLVLCGSPETNAVLARIAPSLPIAIGQHEYVVATHRYPIRNNGLQFIYPNPSNPQRYVLVVHGAQWAPRVERNHKMDFLPDFIVYAAETEEDGTRFPTNRVHCAGYFDTFWRISPASMWVDGQ